MMSFISISRLLPRRFRAAAFYLLTFVFCTGCAKEKIAPSAVESSTVLTSAPTAEVFAEMLPHRGTEGYVGSKACQDCHKDQFTSWHRTYHRTMTQVASKESVQGDFNNVVLTNESTRFVMKMKGEEHWVRIEPISGPLPGSNSAPPGGVEVRLGLVTGSHHMQVFWVPEGHGNLQLGFPFTWLIAEKRWVPRNSTFVRPPGNDHRPEAWNIVCSRCHTTGIEPRFHASSRTVETRVAELGISCEACHGPGQRHFDLRTAAVQKGIESKLDPKEIVHPAEITPERASQICGFCHSMKWIDASENWREAGFTYRPGDNLEETTPIIRAATIDSIAGLSQYLNRQPDLLPSFFWNDGMIRVSGREYNGLLDSPCYKGGKFSCLSCHSMHNSEPNDMLIEKAKGARACTDCHEKYATPAAVASHTRHAIGSSGSDCYNCHMPHTTYGVLKAIRSHQVSSPKVADEIETGRPNACNLCHLDKTLAWTANYLAQWYQQTAPPLTDLATNTAQSARLALAGDAGQRALIAWHLGWRPALEVSGTNWVAPLLGQLMDDPYAAVRFVAERSLRDFGLVPQGYDYTLQPETRPLAREAVWRGWQKNVGRDLLPPHRQAQLLAWPEDLARQRSTYEQLLAWRDHRPVRLRE